MRGLHEHGIKPWELGFACFLTVKMAFGPGGGVYMTGSIHDRESNRASYCKPKKIQEPEILHP